jgi:hypothetical protein
MSSRRTLVCWSFGSWLLLPLSLTTARVYLLAVLPPSAQSAHHWSRNFALFGETSAAVNYDVWYSSDEITWSQANAASARRYHVSVMFNHNIWVIRGNPNENGTSTTNVVGYSSDGVACIQATSTRGRLQNGSVVLDNKMWVLRSVNTGTLYGDVWCSSYGIIWNQAITAANCAAHGGNSHTIPWCLAYVTALFSVILLQLAILVVCLFFRLIWNQKDSVSALFAQHEQTASALVTATRGMHDQRSTSRRRRTNICPRYLHCGHSLAFISLLLACASSQQMAAPSFSSAYSSQHSSRALTGTSGMN